MTSSGSGPAPSSVDDFKQIMTVAKQLGEQAAANAQQLETLLADPRAALVNAGAPLGSWDSVATACFNDEVDRSAPVDEQLTVRLRDSGPDSWACWACYYGLKAVMYSAITAAGIVLATTPWAVCAVPVVTTLAEVIGWSAAAVAFFSDKLTFLSADAAIPRLADMICNAIPDTCSPPKPYTGLWNPDNMIDSWASTEPPALVGFGGHQVLLHRGWHDDNLWWGTYSAVTQNWAGDTPVSAVQLVGSPAAVTVADTLVVMLQAANDTKQLHVRTITDTSLANWGSDITTPIALGAAPPALQEFVIDEDSNTVGVLVVGPATDRSLHAIGYAPATNAIVFDVAIPEATSDETPALEWFSGQLVCAYKDQASSKLAVTSSVDGRAWAESSLIDDTPMLGGPALISQAAANLYCLYTGADKTLRYLSAPTPQEGGDIIWSTGEAVGEHLSQAAPSLAVQGTTLLAAYVGATNTRIYWSSATP